MLLKYSRATFPPRLTYDQSYYFQLSLILCPTKIALRHLSTETWFLSAQIQVNFDPLL